MFLPRASAIIMISTVSLVERFDINELQNWSEFSLEISDGDQSGTGLLLFVVDGEEISSYSTWLADT